MNTLNKKTINDPVLGKITIRKNKRSRRIRIALEANGDAIITIPWRLSYDDAVDLARTKSEWLASQRTKIKVILNNWESLVESKKLTRSTAKKNLAVRLNELAEQHNYKYAKASFRLQKGRWGSCSATNNISLNLCLAFLPDHLCDYVILHELVHTKHKNHGPNFWKELDTCINGLARKHDRELKKYKPNQNIFEKNENEKTQ